MMPVNLLRRAGVILASAIAVVAMTATPAAATEGWFVHSGGYPGDIFGDMPCLDKGAELKAGGVIQAFYCQTNSGNGLWDLWAIQGTWVFHSRHGDVFDCADEGYEQVYVEGNAYTWECRAAPTTIWYSDLYLILT